MTTHTQPARAQSVPTEPSDAELKATVYFAVGVSSESGNNAYRLVVAGDNPRTPLIESLGNSGYTIGTIQTDLGWHYEPNKPHGENVPRDLVTAYQHWAQTQGAGWVLTPEQARQAEQDLGRQGHAIVDDNGRPLDPQVKSKIDALLGSDAGISWVHGRDVAQVEKISANAIVPLKATPLYAQSSVDDRIRLSAMVAKLYNQSEVEGSRLIGKLQRQELTTLQEVTASIGAIRPKIGDFLETGRDDALRGAEVVVALRSGHVANPLRAAWEHSRDNALTNPTELAHRPGYPQLPHEYATVRNLFVHHDQAVLFVEALDRGATFKYGALDKAHPDRFKGAGFYAAGDDFVTWADNGRGHARIGGAWSEIHRDELSRHNRADQTIDLQRDGAPDPTTLLHIDPHARPLRPPLGTPTHAAADPLHRQAEDAVRRLDASLGRAYDERSACMAASLACLARDNRMDRIDHVVLSDATGRVRKGENVFVVQGGLADATNRVAHMKTHEAIAMPVEQSLQQLATAPPSQAPNVPHRHMQDAATRQPSHRMTV